MDVWVAPRADAGKLYKIYQIKSKTLAKKVSNPPAGDMS